MKWFVAGLLVLTLMACSLTGPGGSKESFEANALLARTINFGDTLEVPPNETWGVPLDEKYFDLIKDAGFTAIRLPIGWSYYVGAGPEYAVSDTIYEKVDRAIKLASDRQLAIILDYHSDAQLRENAYAARDRFVSTWRQIAAHYKDEPTGVIFEILNEPSEGIEPYWNDYMNQALTAIRQTNPSRAVIVGPVTWYSPERLKDLYLPRDDANLIVSIHNYRPYHFTHQGAGWINGSDAWLNLEWGDGPDRAEMLRYFDIASDWAAWFKRPIFMGEFGVFGKADSAKRARWTSFVRTEAEKRGFSWGYWEFGSGFGLYDRKAERWNTEVLKSLIPNTKLQ